jgi:dTDP-4-dehydrorhamnose 3,5-epimerase
MRSMDVVALDIPAVKRITPRVFGDRRGSFSETWSARRMAEAGLDIRFVQDSQSFCARAGTIRGLHFQAPPQAQGKLVRVPRGCILDVAVDARAGSPTYGRHVRAELSAENAAQLWIPRGFLHGFVTLEDDTVILYKQDEFYAPDCEGTVHFADPDLGIDWGVAPAEAIVSDKDACAPSFADFRTPFLS